MTNASSDARRTWGDFGPCGSRPHLTISQSQHPSSSSSHMPIAANHTYTGGMK
jgi:hypothetical protein